MAQLAVANRVTIWLNNQEGFDEYMAQFNNPNYFLYFNKTYKTDGTLQKLYDALTVIRNNIVNGTPKPKGYGFALVKNVPGGKAGSAYLYAIPEMQTADMIRQVEADVVATCTRWANDNRKPISNPQYNPNDELFMSFYISL